MMDISVHHRSRFSSLIHWAIPLVIFALALAARAPRLGTFNTVDEPRWIYRSAQFAGGLLFDDFACPPVVEGRSFAATGWACTFQRGYPGVTTMWGGGLGLLVYYWQAVRPTGLDLRTFLQDVEPLDATLIAPTRLPLAVVAALFFPFFYWLLRRLLGGRVALVSTLLAALHPFHLALSRVLHTDALTTTFMVLSLLAMIGYWLQGWKRRWLIASAVLAGAAFLTKQVSWFMMPYAAMLGGLSLYYRWRNGAWRGWSEVGRLAGEGVLWGLVAWAAFAALFPAMWVVPGPVLRALFDWGSNLAETGHEAGTYFLGRVSSDPGPLQYPLGWLLQATPLEVLGLLILPLAALLHYLRSSRPPRAVPPRGEASRRRVQVALLLFVAAFLLFETASSKKMVRYFLPAFPVIDIFVALGLLWLWDNLSRLLRAGAARRWAGAIVAGIVLLVHGAFVVGSYPYYFTYFNPLFGGAPGVARLMGVGWGEGMNEAADYLNRQPGAEGLQVATAYELNFIPFFVGQALGFSDQAGEVMQADYLVYYQHQLQRHLQDMDVWNYYDRHYKPVHRVTLQGLDYALIYRNPIENHVSWQANRLPGVFAVLGYNLAADGNLLLFWQNLGLDPSQSPWAGLAPAAGGEPHWVMCEPVPAFAAEVGAPGAILESRCPLAQASSPTGFYDLQLGLGDGASVSPVEFSAGRLALEIDAAGRFSRIDREAALSLLIQWGQVTPLDISFSDTAQWIGYQFEPAAWQPGDTGELDLYWKMNRRLDLSLVSAFQVVLRLSPGPPGEPALTMSYPVIPHSLSARDLSPGAIFTAQYPMSLPATLTPGDYSLDACLTLAGSGQAVPGTRSGSSQADDCLRLPVTVRGP